MTNGSIVGKLICCICPMLIGGYLGYVLAFLLCGLMVDYASWKEVFYTSGASSLLICVFWIWLVYDSPDQHPTISEDEKVHIHSNVVSTRGAETAEGKKSKPMPPLLDMAKSIRAWTGIISWWTFSFGFFFVTSVFPSYLDKVQNLAVATVRGNNKTL